MRSRSPRFTARLPAHLWSNSDEAVRVKCNWPLNLSRHFPAWLGSTARWPSRVSQSTLARLHGFDCGTSYRRGLGRGDASGGSRGSINHWRSCVASGIPVDTEARMRARWRYRWFLFRSNPCAMRRAISPDGLEPISISRTADAVRRRACERAPRGDRSSTTFPDSWLRWPHGRSGVSTQVLNISG
jgi:hypothetical protein